MATNTVGSHQVINDSLGSVDLKDGKAVKAQDVVDGTIRGADVNEATISGVASAVTANDAFSVYGDAARAMPNSLFSPGNPLATMVIPHAGSYVITATLEAYLTFSYAGGACVLDAAGDSDRKDFELIRDTDSSAQKRYEDIALHVVHTFDDAGSVTLACYATDGYGGGNPGLASAQNTRITALQVNNLTDTGF